MSEDTRWYFRLPFNGLTGDEMDAVAPLVDIVEESLEGAMKLYRERGASFYEEPIEVSRRAFQAFLHMMMNAEIAREYLILLNHITADEVVETLALYRQAILTLIAGASLAVYELDQRTKPSTKEIAENDPT